MRGLIVRPVAAALALLAAWVGVAPYTGRWFGFTVATRPVVEVVDHVVPAVVVLAVAAFGVATSRLPWSVTLVAVLAGLWTFATHVPLLVDAGRGFVPWATALWHSVPGAVLFVVTIGVAGMAWRHEAAEGRP